MAEHEATREALYRRCLALREAATQAERTSMLEAAVLRSRVTTAIELIVNRGRRRAERDPAYALVREWAQGRVAEETTLDDEEFDRLRREDFEEMIEAFPAQADRLRDLAHEFGVHLGKRITGGPPPRRRPGDGDEDQEEESGQAQAAPPAANETRTYRVSYRDQPGAPEPRLWGQVRRAMEAEGIERGTVERVIRKARNPERPIEDESDGPPHGDVDEGPDASPVN